MDEDTRARLYQAYATTHAGILDEEGSRHAYERDIKRHAGSIAGKRTLDIGCGQGTLVKHLLADGARAEGVDISPEQVQIARDNGTIQVHLGRIDDFLYDHKEAYDLVTATDILEHLPVDEVIRTVDLVAVSLKPGGLFIARVPNAGSPFGGRLRHGDMTHESWYTARSVAQLCRTVGLKLVAVKACPPFAHGLKSALRAGIWAACSTFFTIALIAETGVLRGHVVTQNLVMIARRADMVEVPGSSSIGSDTS